MQRVHHVTADVERQLVAQPLERHAVALRRALGDYRASRHALLHLVLVLLLTCPRHAHATLRTHVLLSVHEAVPTAARACPFHRLRQGVQGVCGGLHARSVAPRASHGALRVGAPTQRTLHHPRPGYSSRPTSCCTEGLLVRCQRRGQLLHEGEVLVFRVLWRLRHSRQGSPSHLEEGGRRVHGEV